MEDFVPGCAVSSRVSSSPCLVGLALFSDGNGSCSPEAPHASCAPEAPNSPFQRSLMFKLSDLYVKTHLDPPDPIWRIAETDLHLLALLVGVRTVSSLQVLEHAVMGLFS